jgi:hypothetical protein
VRIYVFGSWLIVALLTSGTARAEPLACQEAGSEQGVVQGTLGLLEGLGPAAFIVKVPGGVCLKGTGAGDSVEQAMSVQLFSNSAAGFQELYSLVGEKVYVRGKLSGLKTFQQKAPILMEVIEIATR